MIKEIKGTRGTRYIKDGKFIAKAKLTDEELLQIGETPTPVNKSCIFCGIHSRLTRFVNLQTVYLCDQHYEEMSLGKVAQRLAEMAQSSA